ncbi:MAG: hypothetical protein QGG39_17930, partial [Candidatus Poribacteria bacterium]|nr:hypothetical protein [Candidatus Poribacteria bacterium]
GAKEGRAFLPQNITLLFTSICGREDRISGDGKEFRDYLRDMFKSFGIGDTGADKNSQPLLNFSTNALEPAYIFALINLYRVEPKAEFLTMAEQIGDNLLQASQHADSGLFTLEDDFILQNPVMDKPELQEGHEGKSTIEFLSDHHKNGKSRSDGTAGSAQHLRRTNWTVQYHARLDSGWSLPQGQQRRSYSGQRNPAMVR